MASSTTKYELLDYTVSYKAVWTGLGLLVAAAVAGLFIREKVKPPGEDEKARQEIKAAERLYGRAGSCLTPDTPPPRQEQLREAGAGLNAARTALDQSNFPESVAQARAAASMLREFIDKTCATRDAVAEFLSVSGDVKVKKVQSPRWVPARKDTELFTGDRIKTGDGQALYFYLPAGETLEMGPATILEIKNVTKLPDGNMRSETAVEMGDVAMKSVPGAASTLETPNAVVHPKGGDYLQVEIHDGKDDLVRSTLGESEVRDSSGKTVKLGRNTRVEVGKGTLGSVTKDLPEVELVEPINDRIFTVEKPEDAQVVFQWRAMDGAQRYLINLGLRNALFRPVLNEGDESVQGTSADITGLPPGKYYWRVRAVDYNGVPGRWSEARGFSIRATSGEEVAKRKPPALKITDQVPIGDKVIVNGQTDPYVTLELYINDRKYGNVDVLDKGDFQYIVPLEKEGQNKIEFVARDTYGTEARKVIYETFFY